MGGVDTMNLLIDLDILYTSDRDQLAAMHVEPTAKAFIAALGMSSNIHFFTSRSADLKHNTEYWLRQQIFDYSNRVRFTVHYRLKGDDRALTDRQLTTLQIIQTQGDTIDLAITKSAESARLYLRQGLKVVRYG